MISVKYVNDTLPIRDEFNNRFDKYLYESSLELDEYFSECCSKYIKYTIENDDDFYISESEGKNIFEKIGEKLIEISKKFVKAIEIIAEKIKELMFKGKSDSQKLEALIKKNPSYANEIKIAFDKGALDLNDIKSLNELDKAFDEIMKLSKRENVDPKSLKAKWNKAKDKFEKDSKSWNIVKVATATTATITALLALKKFIPNCKEATKHSEDLIKKSRIEDQKIREELLKSKPESKDYGKWRFLLDANMYRKGKIVEVENNKYSILKKLQISISNAIDKASKDKSDMYFKNIEKISNMESKNNPKP